MSNKFCLTLDSSQLSNFSDCPQLWDYANNQHIGFEHESEKEAMNAGTLGHQILDVFYTKRSEGESLNESAAAAFAFNPDTEFKCACGHILKEHTRNLLGFNNGCSRCITHAPCWKFEAVPFVLSQDLRIAVKTRLREYFLTYAQNDFIPNSTAAIEVGFSKPIYEDSENLFVLEGRIDLIGTWQGLSTIVDHKFQMRKRDLYPKSIQFRNYDLVCDGLTNMLVINYIRLTQKVDKTTLVREPVTFTSLERTWWKERVIKKFFSIKSQLLSGEFERNEGMCGGKYGYPCAYTPLCEEINPETRERKKQSLFVIKEAWKPW